MPCHGLRHPVWFALGNDRPLVFTAGLRTQWTSVHLKAMPVILTTPQERHRWLSTPTSEALLLQRPLPDGSLKMVAEGAHADAL